MSRALWIHWPEYVFEAIALGLFMVSACLVTALFEYPASPFYRAIANAAVRRVFIGLAMGLTAVALIYSPWGKRSGAHMNPSVTLAFYRLGRVAPWDAVFYVLAQTLGGTLGVLLSFAIAPNAMRHPAVHFIVTVPGNSGLLGAAVGEAAISFFLMLTVLAMSASRYASGTGLVAGALVALYIAVEAPYSGMSMNPARSAASSIVAGDFRAWWLYVLVPPLSMLAAAEVFVRSAGWLRGVRTKLPHSTLAITVATLLGLVSCAGVRPHPTSATGRAAGKAVEGLGTVSPSREPSMEASVRSVECIGLSVSSIDRIRSFYEGILSFHATGESILSGPPLEALEGIAGARVRRLRLTLGSECIELSESLGGPRHLMPKDSQSNDLWFQHIAIVVRDIDAAYRRLEANHVAHVSLAPQTLPAWNHNAANIRAYYFQDPDGHTLELIWFPADKGQARWHSPPGSPGYVGSTGSELFLGIDHTAVASSDTERSLAFYVGRLGLHVQGGSENFGIEQERLSGVDGARVRITTLRADAGPGVELLQYLAPAGGRPMAPGERADDLTHWRTVMVADAVSSPQTLRDPDGHVMEIH